MTAPQTHPKIKLQTLREELNQTFLERESIIDGLLALYIARQHGLLLGPPGTGKSALVSAASQVFNGAQYFQWLLTKFTTPEEIFGPYSISALQQDRFERLTTNYLPTAHVAFLDEIFKANSAILNALLTLLNERLFYNNGVPAPSPLITCIGASNELPEGAELAALYDRFTLRYWVGYVQDTDCLKQILLSRLTPLQTRVSLDKLTLMQQEAAQLDIPAPVVDGLLTIKDQLETENLVASDRRWKQILRLLQAYAYIQGDVAVSEEHFDLLPDCLWSKPQDRQMIQRIVAKVGNPITVKALEILDAAKEAVQQLGQPNAQDAQAKIDWMSEATAVDAQLQQQLDALDQLLTQSQTPKRKAQRARTQVADMRAKLVQQIKDLYQL